MLLRVGKKFRAVDFLIDKGDLKFILEDGQMVRVVPKSKRRAVFEEAHSGNLAGHFTAKKLIRLLRIKVFREKLEKDVTTWVKEGQECFLTNPRPKLISGLKPFVACKPFEIVCADVLEMGVSANGMKYILVLVDHFSKWMGTYALVDKSAASVATAIFQRWSVKTDDGRVSSIQTKARNSSTRR